MKKVAINGFGRIGRAAARIILQKFAGKLELVAINNPAPAETDAHLFAFDTNYGKFSGEVSVENDGEIFNFGGQKIRNFSTREIADLPWKKLGVDIVLECTGVFKTAETAGAHILQGAKKVLLSCPAKDENFTTIVIGANEKILTGDEKLISNASCTTNCLAPVAKILHDEIGIESGLMTTIHSYTNGQNLLDVKQKDLRRARAAAENIIPTTTGAAKAVGKVLPDLKGKLNGISIRVPTPTVSLVDFVFKSAKKVSEKNVNEILQNASQKNPHILGFETRPLVSSDFKCDSRSSIVDAAETMVADDLVKILAWYDNEWGYSCRLVELASIL